MYIKNIKLKNYRNYESLNNGDGINLGKNVTVLIGKNGAGKTNLISAMRQALSFVFRRAKRTPQYDFLASLDKRIRVKSFEPTDAHYSQTSTGMDYHYPIDIETTMSLQSIDATEDASEMLNWHMYKENASKGLDESYASASNAFWKHFPAFQDLPVIAFYSAAFPHVTAGVGEKIKKMLDFGSDLPQNHGYYKWADAMDCTPIWKECFTMRWWNNLSTPNKEIGCYIEAICQCLIDFSRPLPVDEYIENDILELNKVTVKKLTSDASDIIFDFKNGKSMAFSSLPDGYNRIFSIVFDIANRSYLLNKHCNPEGIVFIDELDIHLHPSLAQEILDRLCRSFPKLQFILTTHSPLVISNFRTDENNLVYKLSDGEIPELMPNTYGIDYNTLLSGQMETPIRNSFLRELANAYKHWKTKGDTERMERILKKIINRVGENSLFVQNIQK